MKTLKLSRRWLLAIATITALLLAGGTAYASTTAAPNAAPQATVPNPDPCDELYKKDNVKNLKAYLDCRLDRIEQAIPEKTVPGPTTTVTVTGTPTSTTSTTSTTTQPPTSTTTQPTTTTTTPTSTALWNCIQRGDVDCGYYYDKISNSNGYNTYVSTDCWGHPGCDYLLEANNPGDWQVTATEPLGNTAVVSYPDTQQLTNNWNPDTKTFSGSSDLPRAGMNITSTYSERMNETSGTAAQAAWDIWTSSGELMVWVDEVGRGSGGAKACGSGTLSGHPFTYYMYGGAGDGCQPGGLPIIKLDQNLREGTIDLGEALDYFTTQGVFTADGTIGQINFGWELCSTGGVPQTFQMLDYSLTMTPA